MLQIFYQFLFLILTYFIAAIPFGLVLSKAFGKKDLRDHGSGNIGATNAARVLGKKFGLAVLLLDGLKGAAMVTIGRFLFPHSSGLGIFLVLVGLVAVLAHIFPIYLKFRGGKGVATTAAVLLVILPKVGFFVCLTWLAIFAATRISALAALISIGLAPFYALYSGALKVEIALCVALTILIFWRHKENILRLKQGRENKF